MKEICSELITTRMHFFFVSKKFYEFWHEHELRILQKIKSLKIRVPTDLVFRSSFNRYWAFNLIWVYEITIAHTYLAFQGWNAGPPPMVHRGNTKWTSKSINWSSGEQYPESSGCTYCVLKDIGSTYIISQLQV